MNTTTGSAPKACPYCGEHYGLGKYFYHSSTGCLTLGPIQMTVAGESVTLTEARVREIAREEAIKIVKFVHTGER